MGPLKFDAARAPELKVRCIDANGNNASRHLRKGTVYTVTNIVHSSTTAKGKASKDGYALKGVDYVWDAARFVKA